MVVKFAEAFQERGDIMTWGRAFGITGSLLWQPIGHRWISLQTNSKMNFWRSWRCYAYNSQGACPFYLHGFNLKSQHV